MADPGASIPGGLGEQSPTFLKVGVKGLVISTNRPMWRLDRQTDTRKAAIVISPSLLMLSKVK